MPRNFSFNFDGNSDKDDEEEPEKYLDAVQPMLHTLEDLVRRALPVTLARQFLTTVPLSPIQMSVLEHQHVSMLNVGEHIVICGYTCIIVLFFLSNMLFVLDQIVMVYSAT